MTKLITVLFAVTLAACASNSDTAATSGSSSPPRTCGSGVLEPFACDHIYPNPLLSYDPAAAPLGAFAGAPKEIPNGAAAGRVDVASGTVASAIFHFANAVPAVPRVAVWQEPSCGTPTSTSLPWQDINPASVTTFAGATLMPLPAHVVLNPDAGYTWVAVQLTGSDVLVKTAKSSADPHEPRFAWYGLIDANCDGVNDTALGWEDIRTPSATGVDSASADLFAGVALE